MPANLSLAKSLWLLLAFKKYQDTFTSKRMRSLAFLITFLFAMATWLPATAPDHTEGWSYDSDTMRLNIADASTWVSIARVNLKISELSLEEGRLTGKYDMKVPLFSKNNEGGKIDLKFSKAITDLRETGGMMEGVGIKNDNSAELRDVTCEIFPSDDNKDRGRIVLKIDTGDRVLTFDTTYAVEGKS